MYKKTDISEYETTVDQAAPCIPKIGIKKKFKTMFEINPVSVTIKRYDVLSAKNGAACNVENSPEKKYAIKTIGMIETPLQ